MKAEVRLLKAKAINSLTLCVDHFNRPFDVGRVEAVLMLLDHAFEMLLKASILHRGGSIREKNAKNTIGFDLCVRRALSDGQINFLKGEQALALQTINGLRDAAQHHLLTISEGHLYMQAQAGITLARDLLKDVFGDDLSSHLPDRVLPISTMAPVDPITLFTEELEQVSRMLAPGRRKRTEANARLRALAIVDGAIRGEKLQPEEGELNQLAKQAAAGRTLAEVFPGIVSVNFTTEQAGTHMNLRITKKEGIPVQIVPEGTEGATVVAVRRVDDLGFYNLGHKELAAKVGLTPPKATAAVRYLNLVDDPDCCKEISIGRSKFRRYSQKAIAKIKDAVSDVGIDTIWQEHRPR